MSGSTTLLGALLSSPLTPIPGAPTLPWVLLVLIQAVPSPGAPCKGRGHHLGAGSGVVHANGKGDGASPPQGFIAAGRCPSLQSCCCHSPAPLGTAESKAEGWGCCRDSMSCQESSGSGLSGSASSRGIQFSSSYRKTLRYFFSALLPTLHPSPILMPGSSPFHSHSQALISLPSQVSSRRLLALLFCPTQPSASDASRAASKFGAQNLAIAP